MNAIRSSFLTQDRVVAHQFATKFAVVGFTESLSYELAPFGISAKAIAPGGKNGNGKAIRRPVIHPVN